MEVFWGICFWVVGLALAVPTHGVTLIAMILGVIVGAIAKNKGRPFWGWAFWGSMLFIVALPHVLLISKNDNVDGFRVDGTYEGIAFRRNSNGSVTARLDGTNMQFPSEVAFRDLVNSRKQLAGVSPSRQSDNGN